MEDARHAAEAAARASYGRLLALVAVRTRDIAAAEDALSEAFRQAMEVWPRQGPPARPEAWLLTVARRSAGRVARHTGVRDAASATLRLIQDEAVSPIEAAFPDERLKLLFVCAHPAIDEAARTPLMLQTVLGIDSARIAAAFVTSPAAMAQRLVRAKTKIRDARLRFEAPGPEDLPERLEAVLNAVYAAYGTAWDEGLRTGLAEEAIFLGRLLVALAPEAPEARGLLALMLYCEARAAARRSPSGDFVPLAEQDVALWSREMIVEAEKQLATAARARIYGRFQTEAAIQSVHAQRAVTGSTNLEALVTLYDLLASREASLGVLVARAAVHGDAFGPQAGLEKLADLEAGRVETYQPYWAVKSHLLKRAGQAEAAATALELAIGLSDDPAVRAYLARRALSLSWPDPRRAE